MVFYVSASISSEGGWSKVGLVLDVVFLGFEVGLVVEVAFFGLGLVGSPLAVDCILRLLVGVVHVGMFSASGFG